MHRAVPAARRSFARFPAQRSPRQRPPKTNEKSRLGLHAKALRSQFAQRPASLALLTASAEFASVLLTLLRERSPRVGTFGLRTIPSSAAFSNSELIENASQNNFVRSQGLRDSTARRFRIRCRKFLRKAERGPKDSGLIES